MHCMSWVIIALLGAVSADIFQHEFGNSSTINTTISSTNISTTPDLPTSSGHSNGSTSNTTTAASTTSGFMNTTTSYGSTSTTMKPTASPPNDPYTYALAANGTVCFLLHATIQITLYNNNSMSSAVPGNAKVTGTCSNSTDNMHLLWSDSGASMDLQIQAVISGSSFYMSRVELTYTNYSGLGNGSISGNVTNFTTPNSQYYTCSGSNSVQLTNLTVDFKDLKMQVSDSPNKNATISGNAFDCKASNKTDAIVPIAVGCALAAMVLIVLVGYCIGRRRTRAGYQSMNA